MIRGGERVSTPIVDLGADEDAEPDVQLRPRQPATRSLTTSNEKPRAVQPEKSVSSMASGPSDRSPETWLTIVPAQGARPSTFEATLVSVTTTVDG